MYGFEGCSIPDHMMRAIEDYVERGYVEHGDLLEAIVCNDLKEAVRRADDTNIKILPLYVNHFYNYTPSNCWGSREKMDLWVFNKRVTQERDEPWEPNFSF